MPADSLGVLVASTTKTASSNGDSYDLKTGTPRRGIKVRQLITAASGTTPTLAGKVQHSDDGSSWSDLVNFESASAVGVQHRTVETSKRYIRHVATIGGTSPSFTFAVEIVAGRP